MAGLLFLLGKEKLPTTNTLTVDGTILADLDNVTTALYRATEKAQQMGIDLNLEKWNKGRRSLMKNEIGYYNRQNDYRF